MSFAAFSDESRHNDGRFRSIATVSLPANQVVPLREELRLILGESSVNEFKWANLKDARTRACGEKLVDFTVDRLLAIGGRVDVLTWDTNDTRHRVIGRDDTQNFERMFFHLHKKVMERRELGANWHLRADERVDVDWQTVQNCLKSVGLWKKYMEETLIDEDRTECYFHVRSFKQVNSAETPLCQLADMFAGMTPYSRQSCELIRRQLDNAVGQGSLLSNETELRPSARERERFAVIKRLSERCHERRLGVSLRTHGYLVTPDPSNPLNFWHYKPQHAADRAPTRS